MRAILSVSDKSGIVEFAKCLEKLNIEIISSGGTYELLKQNHVSVKQVSDITGFTECLDGRVKTLHPNIHGAILANRDIKEHMNTLEMLDITPIDIVVVNLYPFKKIISKPGHTFDEAVENMDIGGPAMIRAAAKNHKDVLVVTDFNDYDTVIEKLETNSIDMKFRQSLALKAFETTAIYDIMISNYLKGDEKFTDKILLSLDKKEELRYGENPHQQAAYYSSDYMNNKGVESAQFLHGKELSYNNYNDAQGAIDLCMEFEMPACVAVKHSTPCGAAIASNIHDAYERAYNTDPVSVFGGIICFNRTVDESTAVKMSEIFLEVIIAPDFEQKALDVLKKKKNLRLLKMPDLAKPKMIKHLQYKSIGGGFLVQNNDTELFSKGLNIVTKTKVSDEQIEDMKFAMTVVKHVKSNAIVIVKDKMTVGIGGGDVSRIFASKSALERAGEKAKGAVLASDAFFPFEDVVQSAYEYGIKAIIQPGGSLNDQKSIDECDKNNIAMIFTGIRHFRH